jgi:hypothetical protein
MENNMKEKQELATHLFRFISADASGRHRVYLSSSNNTNGILTPLHPHQAFTMAIWLLYNSLKIIFTKKY